MKRKLIITESQYIKLQEFLFETPYRNLYSKIEENDIIEIINKGVPSQFKVTSFINNYIIMDGISPSISKYAFAIDKDGLYKSNFEAKKILKNKLNNNIDTWPAFNTIITSFKLIRNGKVIDDADMDDKKQPQQQQQQQPQQQEPIGKPDEISEPVEMDPNTPEKQSEEEPSEEDFNEMISNIEAEYKSDDIFRKALFTQPSFWERLKGEISGSQPQGSGIIIANKLVNSYRDKGSNDFLNANFIKNNKALYKPLDNYDLEYYIDNKLDYISLREDDNERLAKVNNSNEKNQRELKDVKQNFIILVTKNISTKEIPNAFLCFVTTYSIKNGKSFKNKPVSVKLQFFQSTGFNIKDKK